MFKISVMALAYVPFCLLVIGPKVKTLKGFINFLCLLVLLTLGCLLTVSH